MTEVSSLELLTRISLKRKIWLLSLLDALERAAVTPISQQELHRLAYLANVLSPVYDLDAEDGRILKYRRGPYYPDLQWDLDRLAVSGLAEISNISHRLDDLGWWYHADYALSPRGKGIVADARRRFEDYDEIHRFHCEVAAAFGAVEDECRTDAALQDATYSESDDEVVIDYAEWRGRNLSAPASDLFAECLGMSGALGSRRRVQLYVRYLGRMVERNRQGVA